MEEKVSPAMKPQLQETAPEVGLTDFAPEVVECILLQVELRDLLRCKQVLNVFESRAYSALT